MPETKTVTFGNNVPVVEDTFHTTVSNIDEKINIEIDKVNNSIRETLKPLEVLVEEQNIVIMTLTNNISILSEDNNFLSESNICLTNSNSELASIIDTLRYDLDENNKINELLKIELKITRLYGFISSLVILALLILHFI